MLIFENNEPKNIEENSKVGELYDENRIVVIIDGYQADSNYELKNNDRLTVIEKGKMPDKNQLKNMLSARHSPHVADKVSKSTVTILGLGGLGSNIAVMLARLGIGRLRLVDYDIVEPSNLNRQSYYVDDLGVLKTTALKKQIMKINPFVDVETVNVKADASNIVSIVMGSDVVCEAFDKAETKAMAVNAILSNDERTVIIAASGMAGYGDSNQIVTRRIGNRLILCGDSISDSSIGVGLMSPRVTICAAHQANAVLRILLGEKL